MQNRPLISLGEYSFSIDTAAHETLLRQSRERYATLQPIAGHTRLQHLGPGEHRIELEGRIFPHFRGGLQQINQLRDLQAKGEPQLLLSGEGDVIGYWVIETVEEQQSALQSGGSPLKQEFRIGLHYYGPRPE